MGDNAPVAQERRSLSRSHPREKTRRGNHTNNKKNKKNKASKAAKGSKSTKDMHGQGEGSTGPVRRRLRLGTPDLRPPSLAFSPDDNKENMPPMENPNTVVPGKECSHGVMHFRADGDANDTRGSTGMLLPAIMRSFRDPAEVHERTPTAEDIRSVDFRRFLKLLRPQEMRLVSPTPLNSARHLCCVENVLQYIYHRVQVNGEDESDFDIVFGFIVYFDPGCHFFRANGHTWLRRKSDSLWIDPTPSPDPEDTSLLLVRSERFLTDRERSLVLASPNCYTLGAMVSHKLIPAQFMQSDFPYDVLGVMYHAVATPAEDLRIYSLTQKRPEGMRVVAVQYEQQTRVSVAGLHGGDIVAKASDFDPGDVDISVDDNNDEGECTEVAGITKDILLRELADKNASPVTVSSRPNSAMGAIHI